MSSALARLALLALFFLATRLDKRLRLMPTVNPLLLVCLTPSLFMGLISPPLPARRGSVATPPEARSRYEVS